MREQLFKIVEAELPLSPEADIERIVNHLLSREVRVQKLRDLRLVQSCHLATLDLGPIEVKSLLETFKTVVNGKYHSNHARLISHKSEKIQG